MQVKIPVSWLRTQVRSLLTGCPTRDVLRCEEGVELGLGIGLCVAGGRCCCQSIILPSSKSFHQRVPIPGRESFRREPRRCGL